MNENTKTQILEIGKFKAMFFNTTPPRLESSVIFDGDSLGQKLIFKMMDICWKYGFGCASPKFKENKFIIFSIGTIINSVINLKKYCKNLELCLDEILEFSKEYMKQLNFNNLDISMFKGLDYYDLNFPLIAAIRDQHFEGNWEKYKEDTIKKGKKNELKAIKACKKFEKINKRDIGLVANNLLDVIELLFDEENEVLKN